MEPIQHASRPRRKANSAKTNLVIAVLVHAIFIAGGAYWAAHEGMLGERLQNITLLQYEKEKKAEAEKKAEVKKAEERRPEAETKPVETRTARVVTPPPPAVAPPPATAALAAPPPAVLPAFSFGGDSGSPSEDPVATYKTYIEGTLRSRWERPMDLADDQFVVEVSLDVDSTGAVVRYDWLKGSDNAAWDQSVRRVIEATRTIGRPPPKGFPPHFQVRFDTIAPPSEPLAVQ